MARMIPCISQQDDFNGPLSELFVYNELKTLPDDYIVFHSVQWNWGKKHGFGWRENDFLILNKDYGILVLEVKGGRIYYSDGYFHQVRIDTGEDCTIQEGSDPLTQAKNGKFHYLHSIKEKYPELDKKLLIEPMIWFPSCTIDASVNLPLCYEDVRFCILDENAFAAKGGVPLSATILSVFKHYKRNSDIPLTDSEVANIVRIIAPDFNLIPSASIIKAEIEHAFIRLTNEQSKLLDYLEEQKSAAIQGAAGTGKTLVAIEAAKRFAADDKKVLYLCFNRWLYEHLKADCACENVSYYNINTLVTEFSSENAETPEERIEELRRITAQGFEYDDVIIDEAQDLENEEILLLKEAMAKKDGRFYVFYDLNQVVHKKKSELTWINDAECRLLLTKNCRNTYEIARTAYKVIDTVVNQKLNTVRGPQPEVCFTPPDDKYSKLAELIRHVTCDFETYTPADVTILSMKGDQNSLLHDMNSICGITLTHTRNDMDVFCTTARKFKGLESKVVIITDIDKACFEDDEQKRVFYVACSRATQKLALFISGTDAEIKSIASIQPGHFKPKAKLMMLTQTTQWPKTGI